MKVSYQVSDQTATVQTDNHSHSKTNLSQHLGDCRRFMRLLEAHGASTYQFFDDSKNKTRGLPPQRLLHGTWQQVEADVVRLNNQGYGAFVTVSQTNLEGRKKGDIVAPRALFLDFDGIEPDTEKLALLPDPSAIVQSKNGKHYYWMLEPGEPLEQLEPALARLIPWLGADIVCKDCSRVLRIPGTLHQKGEPFLTSLAYVGDRIDYTIAEVMANVPALAATSPVKATRAKTMAKGVTAVIKADAKPSKHVTSDVTADNLAGKLRKVAKAEQLAFMCDALAGAKEGGRNALLNAIARHSFHFIATGTPRHWLESEITAAALTAGLAEGEISASIASGFRFAESQALGLKGCRKLWLGFQLRYGDDLRYNERSKELELAGANKSLDLSVERIDFINDAPLVGLAPSKDTFEGELVPWAKRYHSYDPAKAYLEALPAMTTDRAHEVLEGLTGAMGIVDGHEVTLVKRWLVGMVNRVLNPGCAMPWVLVLAGRGGCGKSSFFEQLAPLQKPRYMAALGLGGGIEKDNLMQASKGTLLVIDELDQTTRKADLSALKSFIDRTEDTFRIPYDRSDCTYKRGYAIGATVNGDQPLHDDGAGLRRYGVIQLSGAEVEGRSRYAYYQANAAFIHAAALALLAGGYGCMLTADELEVENSRKESHTGRDYIYAKALQALPALAEKMVLSADRGDGYGLHLTQLIRHLLVRDNATPTQKLDLKKALEVMGWHCNKPVKCDGKTQRLCWPEAIPAKAIKRMSHA